jgi:kynurenine formamidase
MLHYEQGGRRWRVDLEHPRDLSIPLDFAGPQPQFFGAAPARAAPLESGAFTGRVGAGGSCNCDVLTVTPHCNGTHTECAGHITLEPLSVDDVVPRTPLLCRVVTLTPIRLATSPDEAQPPSEPDDLVIDRRLLIEAGLESERFVIPGLVVRTRPNDPGKRSRAWDDVRAPYLTEAAAMHLAAIGVEHLIVDLPSLDRADDGGRLTAHRRFWGLADRSTDRRAASRARCTITELAYVPDDVPDGEYLLALQVAPFVTDAAPSRPVLMRLVPHE